MKVSRSFQDTSVFVLKWEDVDRLHSRLAREFAIVKISATCADGLTRKFLDLKELKEFSNAKRVAIISLEFESRAESYETRSSISFETGAKRNVRFSVDADEVAGTGLNTFYLDFLDSIRPWYSNVAGLDFTILVTLLGVAGFVGISAFVWLKGGVKAAAETSGNTANAVNSLAFAVLIMLSAGLLNRFKGMFYPMGIFAFGDGLRRHENLEVIRTVVIAAFVISIAASIFYGFFI